MIGRVHNAHEDKPKEQTTSLGEGDASALDDRVSGEGAVIALGAGGVGQRQSVEGEQVRQRVAHAK